MELIVGIVFDALIVMIAILGIVIGLKQGFVKMFILRFRRLASLVFAILLAKPLGAVLNQYVIADRMTGWIISAGNVQNAPAESTSALLESVPWSVRLIANLFDYNLYALAEKAFANGQGMQTALISDLAYPVASFVSVLIAFLSVFILLCIALKFFGGMLDDIFKAPVLKQINSLLGASVGLVVHLTIIWLLCQLVGFVLKTELLSGLTLLEGFSMEKTWIAKYIYEFNPLAFIFSV